MRTTAINAWKETFTSALRTALGLLFVLTSLAAHAVNEPELLSPEQAFPLEVTLRGPKEVALDFSTRPGYYLYRDRFSFTIDGTPIKPDEMPPGELKNDSTFGMVTVYHRPIQIRLPLPRPITSSIVMSVTSQGCADLGVCYPPQTRDYRVSADGSVRPVATGNNAPAGTGVLLGIGESQLPIWFDFNLHPANGISLAELLGFLFAGLLMAGTVCMYPLIPIVIAVIGGTRERSSFSRGFMLSLAYMQGLAIVYAIAGTLAALIGIPLVAVTQKPWVLAAFGTLMFVFALGMFGLLRLQLPANWQTRFTEWSNRLPGGRVGPVFVAGMLSALIVGPCSTPALAGALLYIANSHDVVGGALALYAMGVGMGIPLLFVGTFGTGMLPRAGRWMVAVQNTLGIMLLAAGLWFVYSLLPIWLLMSLIALLLTGCGVMLRAVDPLPPDVTGFVRIGKAFGILLLVAGVAEFVGVASGNFDILEPLGGVMRRSSTSTQTVRFDAVRSNSALDAALTAAHGQPVMVDFYADWCISCKELERFTFADSRVVSEFAHSHWKLLRIDVTKNTPEDQATLRRFGLFGPPALIFYDSNGKQQHDAQLVGFVGANAFLAHLKKWGQ